MKNLYIIPTNDPSKLIKNNLGYGIVSDAWKQFDIDLIQAQYQNIYITDDSKIRERDWFLNTLNNQVNKCDDLIYEKNVNLSSWCKKIILTTDQDLIKDGVQAIDDEFIEWFVKNPSCESVDVNDWMDTNGNIAFGGNIRYQISCSTYKEIIIPQEEPKQYPSIPLDCTHDIVTKYGVAECQNCGLEESKISKQLTIKEAAEKANVYNLYAKGTKGQAFNEGFIAGAKSDAAKDYWFEKFQQEQDNTKFSDEDMVEFSKWRVIYEENNPNNVKHSKKLLQIWFSQFKNQKQ